MEKHVKGEKITIAGDYLRYNGLPSPCVFKFVREGTRTNKGEVFRYQNGTIDFSGYDDCGRDFGRVGWILRPIVKPPRRDPSLKKVNVLTIDADGKIGRYHFYGVPDWQRIEKETIGEGFKAAIVWPKQTRIQGLESERADGTTELFSKELGIGSDFAINQKWLESAMHRYHEPSKIPATIAEVRAALKNITAKPEIPVVPENPVLSEFRAQHPDKDVMIGAMAAEIRILRDRIEQAASTLKALNETVTA